MHLQVALGLRMIGVVVRIWIKARFTITVSPFLGNRKIRKLKCMPENWLSGISETSITKEVDIKPTL